MTNWSATESFMELMTELSQDPWRAVDFREAPERVLKSVSGLTEFDTRRLTKGSKGTVYRLLCLPFWKEVPGRISKARGDAPALTEVDNSHDVDTLDVDTDIETDTENDIDLTDHDFDFEDGSRPSKGRAKDVLRRVENAIEWFNRSTI